MQKRFATGQHNLTHAKPHDGLAMAGKVREMSAGIYSVFPVFPNASTSASHSASSVVRRKLRPARSYQ